MVHLPSRGLREAEQVNTRAEQKKTIVVGLVLSTRKRHKGACSSQISPQPLFLSLIETTTSVTSLNSSTSERTNELVV